MPPLFVHVEVDPEVARQPEVAKKLVEVCPVNIFALEDGRLEIVEENEDECTLCELCLEAAPPGSVRVIKLYEDPPVALTKR
jgi:NAD-dependent dihydropyrimidine dehydrogenase PreA subunit